MGFLSGPKMPDVQPVPPAAAPPPSKARKDVAVASDTARKRAAMAAGSNNQTIATSPLGLSNPPQTKQNYLLGQ
jgi:hypothetical protein